MTTPPDTRENSAPEALHTAKEHAVRAWHLFTRGSGLRVLVPGWQTSTSPDGRPHLSAEVVGPDAAEALRLFASDYPLVLGWLGDQRPFFDYSTPGRISCAWRCRGVWIEMWHSDTPQPAPVSEFSPACRPRHRSIRLSGWLPFVRNQRKETSA